MQSLHSPDITAAAWNIKDGFSDGDRAPMLLAAIKRQRPTVMFLSEAYRPDKTETLDNALEDIDKLDYKALYVAQELHDDRPDQHGIMMLASRESVADMRSINLAGRRAIQAVMHDPSSGRAYHVFGNHGNDKNEQLRLADEAAKYQYYDLDGGRFQTPTIDMGDKNTMRPDSLTARQLRFMRPFTHLLPSQAPDPENPATGLRRYGSLAQRLTGMALGDSYHMYEAAGLVNADAEDTPTMWQKVGPVSLSVKVDHIFCSPDFLVTEHDVHTRNVSEEAGLYTPASDHRAISATLRLRSA